MLFRSGVSALGEQPEITIAIDKKETTSVFCNLENIFILSVIFLEILISRVVRSHNQERTIPGTFHHVLDDSCERYPSIPVG